MQPLLQFGPFQNEAARFLGKIMVAAFILLFGLVHGQVGMFNQILSAVSISRENGNSDARTDIVRLPFQGNRLRDCLNNTFSDRLCIHW